MMMSSSAPPSMTIPDHLRVGAAVWNRTSLVQRRQVYSLVGVPAPASASWWTCRESNSHGLGANQATLPRDKPMKLGVALRLEILDLG